MSVVMIILGIILGLDSLALIVLVLMQQSRQQGLSGAIGGSAETFFGKKKASSFEGKLELFTKVTGAIFLTLALAMCIIQQFV